LARQKPRLGRLVRPLCSAPIDAAIGAASGL